MLFVKVFLQNTIVNYTSTLPYNTLSKQTPEPFKINSTICVVDFVMWRKVHKGLI